MYSEVNNHGKLPRYGNSLFSIPIYFQRVECNPFKGPLENAVFSKALAEFTLQARSGAVRDEEKQQQGCSYTHIAAYQ